MNSNSTIEALVNLIDDPDTFVFEHVRGELIDQGAKVIPFLESSWVEDSHDLLFHQRVDKLIREIHFSEIKKELKAWIDSDKKDLLTGALIIAKYQYTHLDEESVIKQIDEIRNDIWVELNPRMTSYEKIKVFNTVFFEMHGFKGNSEEYHSPLNSFINTVIDSRKGNPLSLCILYSIIGQSLDMPIYGVNLPNHFILTYLDNDEIRAMAGLKNTHGNLFYISPFAKGGIFDEKEIDAFLENANVTPTSAFYEPCSNSKIIHRMLNNLINSFQQVGNANKVDELLELRSLFNGIL